MPLGAPHKRSAVREYFNVLAGAAQSAERRGGKRHDRTPQARDNMTNQTIAGFSTMIFYNDFRYCL